MFTGATLFWTSKCAFFMANTRHITNAIRVSRLVNYKKYPNLENDKLSSSAAIKKNINNDAIY